VADEAILRILVEAAQGTQGAPGGAGGTPTPTPTPPAIQSVDVVSPHPLEVIDLANFFDVKLIGPLPLPVYEVSNFQPVQIVGPLPVPVTVANYAQFPTYQGAQPTQVQVVEPVEIVHPLPLPVFVVNQQGGGGGGRGGGRGGGAGAEDPLQQILGMLSKSGGMMGGAAGGAASMMAATGPVGAAIAAIETVSKAAKMMADAMVGAMHAAGDFATMMLSASEAPEEFARNFGSTMENAGDSLANTFGDLTFAISPALFMFGELVRVGGATIAIMSQMMDQFTAMADRYGQYNAGIAQAQAQAEMRQVMGDIRRAGESQDTLVQYIKTRSDLQQKVEDLKVKFMEAVEPIVQKLMEAMEGVVDILSSIDWGTVMQFIDVALSVLFPIIWNGFKLVINLLGKMAKKDEEPPLDWLDQIEASLAQFPGGGFGA